MINCTDHHMKRFHGVNVLIYKRGHSAAIVTWNAARGKGDFAYLNSRILVKTVYSTNIAMPHINCLFLSRIPILP
jgi:hypothetical protein